MKKITVDQDKLLGIYLKLDIFTRAQMKKLIPDIDKDCYFRHNVYKVHDSEGKPTLFTIARGGRSTYHTVEIVDSNTIDLDWHADPVSFPEPKVWFTLEDVCRLLDVTTDDILDIELANSEINFKIK